MRVDLDEVAAEQSVSRDELKSMIAELRLLRQAMEPVHDRSAECPWCKVHKDPPNCPVKALEAMDD